MKNTTTKRIVRDGMSVIGLLCLGAAAWLCPALLCAFAGMVLLGGAVGWQRYEWLKLHPSQRRR